MLEFQYTEHVARVAGARKQMGARKNRRARERQAPATERRIPAEHGLFVMRAS